MKNYCLQIIYKVLASYARKVIERYNPFVIAITGSVGKTSTKEAVYQVLRDQFGDEVRKNEGNLNAEIGVPLTILGYKSLPNKFLWPLFLISAFFRLKPKHYPKYLILEMGIEKSGDMDYLTSLAHPDIAIITSTTPAHTANFKKVEDYQQEKISIIKNLKPSGRVIVNNDDEILSKLQVENLTSIGIKNESSDYVAKDINLSIRGSEYRIWTTGHKIAIKSKVLGEQLIYSQLFSFATAHLLSISLIQAGKSIEKIESVNGRMNLLPGIFGSTIIDDTYNSNPTSLKAALNTLSELKYDGRKVAIIGNMNELGELEKSSHQKIGRFAKDKCDFAIFCGPNAKEMQSGFDDNDKCLIYNNRKELLRDIQGLINKNDLVLVKASQNNNFFEEVVKKILKEPKTAQKVLVRQSRFWMRKK